MAGWQSGHAAACKAVYAGSIPASASINFMKKALFLDRDGVINIDRGYVYKKEDFIFKKEIFSIIKLANSLQYLVIIVTNQSGIARGFYSENDFKILMKWVVNELNKMECYIDDIFFCPFHKDGLITKYTKESNLRKPLPGMFNLASKKFNIDLNNSILIGDNETDILAGNAAGVKTNILLNENFKKKINLPKNIIYTEISNLLDSSNFIK